MPGGKLWNMWEDRALSKAEQKALAEGSLRGPDISTKGEEQREELMKRIKPLLTPAQLAQLEEEKKRLKEPVGRPEDRYIPEREIPKPSDFSVKDMPVTKDGGLANIMGVLELARPDEIEYWRHWYIHAGQDAQALADKYGVPRNVSAAVIALLSPNTKWEDNVFAAEQVLRGQGRKVIEYRKQLDQEAAENLAAAIYPSLYTEKATLGASSYLVNIQKAQRVLDAWEEAGEPANFPIDQGPPTSLTWDPKDAGQTAKAEAEFARARSRGWNTFYAKQEYEPKPLDVATWKQTTGAGSIWDRQEAYEALMRKKRVPEDRWYGKGKMKRTWDAQGRMDRFDPVAGRAVLVPPMKLHAPPKKKGAEQKSTPKVTAFYRSIEEPEKWQNEVVLDGHAINIWRGEPRPLDDLKDAAPPVELREQMIADYKEAAQRATKLLASKGVKLDEPLTPQQVQAITWSVWRNAVQPKKKKQVEASSDGWGQVDFALMHLAQADDGWRVDAPGQAEIFRMAEELEQLGEDWVINEVIDTFSRVEGRGPEEMAEAIQFLDEWLRELLTERQREAVGDIDLTADETVLRTTLESGPRGHPSSYWPDYAKRTFPQYQPQDEAERAREMFERRRQLERGPHPAKQHFTGDEPEGFAGVAELDLTAERTCEKCGEPVGEDGFGSDGCYFHRSCLDGPPRHQAAEHDLGGDYQIVVRRAGRVVWQAEASLDGLSRAASAFAVSAPEPGDVLVAHGGQYELRVSNPDEACIGVVAEAALRTQAWRRVVTRMLHPRLTFLKDAASMNDIVPHREFIAPADLTSVFGFSIPQGETLYFEGFHRPGDDQFYGFQDLGQPAGGSPADNLRLRFMTPDHQLVVLAPRDLEPLEPASGALELGEVPTEEETPEEQARAHEIHQRYVQEFMSTPPSTEAPVTPQPWATPAEERPYETTFQRRMPTIREPNQEQTVNEMERTRRQPLPRSGPQPIPPPPAAEPGTAGDWSFLQMPHGWSPEHIPGATTQTQAPQQTVPARPMPRAPTQYQPQQAPTVPGRPAPYAAEKRYETVLAFNTAGGDTIETSEYMTPEQLTRVADQFSVVARNVTELGEGWLEFAGRPHLGPFGSGRHVLRVNAGADGLQIAVRLGGA
jgi:hypothetical protein